jgi:hypothetical protein
MKIIQFTGTPPGNNLQMSSAETAHLEVRGPDVEAEGEDQGWGQPGRPNPFLNIRMKHITTAPTPQQSAENQRDVLTLVGGFNRYSRQKPG